MSFDQRDLEAIQKAFKRHDTQSLNDRQIKKMIIWDMADNLIRLYGVGRDATMMLQERIKAQFNENVSLRICQEHIGCAQLLYGSNMVYDKKYWRGLIVDRYFKAVRYMETTMFGTTDLKKLHEILDDPEKLKALPRVDSRQMGEYLRALERMTDILELDKPDPPYNPLEEIRTVVITNDPRRAGYQEQQELNKKITQRLLEMGAKRNEDGHWE